MIKILSKTLSATLLATALVTTACSPDQVQPWDGQRSVNKISETIPEFLPPACSDSVYARLQDSAGGYTVNYCVPRPGNPCPPVPPEWGRIEIFNDWDNINFRINLAVGWHIDQLAYKFGSSTPMPLSGTTGRPIVDGSWTSMNIDEYNSYTISVNKADILKDLQGCFQGAMRLKVLRRSTSFLGPWDQGSRRDLYLTTSNLVVRSLLNDANGNLINITDGDPSPYIAPEENILNWCWQSNCRPQRPGGIYLTNQCVAAPAIPGYTCTVTGAGSIGAATVRCLDVDGNYGTITCTGPGTLVIPAGQTITCGINAFYGCTLIVHGTLNWINTASYTNNMYIYVAPGGVINRAGTSASLTTNGAGSVLVNAGTIDIDANLITKGAVYNTGSLTSRNMTLTGGTALLSNNGTVIVEQNLTVNCGTPNTCTASAESSILNCGRLDVNTAISTAAGTRVKNYCSLVSRGNFTQGGSFTNQGLAVAGLSGGGNGYVNNGNTTFEQGSVLVSRYFNWGSNRTIHLNNANAWVITANTTLPALNQPSTLFFQSIGGTGRMVIPAGAALTGSGQLYLVDADPFTGGDLPLSAAAITQTVNPNGYTLLSARPIRAQDDSVRTCTF